MQNYELNENNFHLKREKKIKNKNKNKVKIHETKKQNIENCSSKN